MMNQATNRSNFKAEVLPNLEPLLQIAVWLTRNGLDANRLLRGALAEAYRSWNQSEPEGRCDRWLRGILISRFSDGFQQSVNLTTPGADNRDEIFGGVGPNALTATPDERQHFRQTNRPAEDNVYFEAIAGLPAVCRSAMILSYLEGVSTTGTADVGGVQLQATGPILSPGRSFIREELFEHLMDSAGTDSGADRNAATDQFDPDIRSVILNLNANIDSHTQRSSHD